MAQEQFAFDGDVVNTASAGLNLAGLAVPGLGIAGFALGAFAAARQKEAQNALIEKQKQTAMQNFKLKQTALAQQFDNYKAQAALDDFNQQINTGKAIGSSEVAASSAGISGTTTSNIIKNIRMQNAVNSEIRKRNVMQVASNIESQSASDYLNLTATVENLDAQKMTDFDVLMGGFSGGLSAIGTGQQIAGAMQQFNALETINILEE